MKHNISSIERDYRVEDNSDMILIELQSGITFYVDLWYYYDIDIDPENGVYQNNVEITELKVYDKYKKPAFRWNKKVMYWLRDEIEYFLTKEFKGGNHDFADAN